MGAPNFAMIFGKVLNASVVLNLRFRAHIFLAVLPSCAGNATFPICDKKFGVLKGMSA
jgi:hypothetical protein